CQLVERHWNGPVRVLGGAGTGKTVAAMHRARWLARELPEGERILFTTFTRNLAADIDNNLRTICTPEEMKRIEITNLDRWVQRFLRGKRYRFRLEFDRDRQSWRVALAKKPHDLSFSDAFYNDEWEQVIQSNGVTTREEYLRIPRTGRGVRLTRASRARIWPVFEEYRAQLAERGIMEVADCYRASATLLEQDRNGANFASVIVDEAQDMSAAAWRLIRSIVPRGRDDIFIVGDAHQRIYSRHRVVLSRCGIEIRGRGRKLRLNYRTTEQTRRWASSVLERRSIDDLDGGDDDNKGVHSVTRGPEPLMRHFENRDGQATWLVGYLTDLMDHEVPLRGVCIVSRTQKERDAILEELSDAEVPVEVLEADAPDESSTGVRLATMHRVKGLEFDRVVIASANEDILPLPAAINATDADSSERIAAETAERALLYVSATRAKRELTVLSFGTPSSFLT
ncbi:MAG: AAA family ATPase, partial [Rhodospirillaceae bacterium]|nr:AAA family ATPase [Rhodospirillaceae bacterium]